MCKGGGALGFDRPSRIERWGVATNEEIKSAVDEKGLVWLDVRTPEEVARRPFPTGKAFVVKACKVTMFSTKDLEEQAPKLIPSKAAPILVFCSGGGRAEEARKALKKLGYAGTITNGGMPEDIEEAVPDVLKAAATTKGRCIIS